MTGKVPIFTMSRLLISPEARKKNVWAFCFFLLAVDGGCFSTWWCASMLSPLAEYFSGGVIIAGDVQSTTSIKPFAYHAYSLDNTQERIYCIQRISMGSHHTQTPSHTNTLEQICNSCE